MKHGRSVGVLAPLVFVVCLWMLPGASGFLLAILVLVLINLALSEHRLRDDSTPMPDNRILKLTPWITTQGKTTGDPPTVNEKASTDIADHTAGALGSAPQEGPSQSNRPPNVPARPSVDESPDVLNVRRAEHLDKRSDLTGSPARAIGVLLVLFLLVAVIGGGWLVLLLSIPPLLAFLIFTKTYSAATKPTSRLRPVAPLFKALKVFFLYATVGMLIVAVETAFFRDVNAFDYQVHWYEEKVGKLAEFVEAHLSLSLANLLLVTIVLIVVDRYFKWNAVERFFKFKGLISKISIVFAVLTSFTFINVAMVESLKPGWLWKREKEIKELAREVGKKRYHELRLAFVKEKMENLPETEKHNLVSFIQATSQTPSGAGALVQRGGYDEGDGADRYEIESKFLKQIIEADSSTPRGFSYSDLEMLESENAELEEKNQKNREAAMELVKGTLSAFLPSDLNGLLQEFSNALIDGAVDTAAEAVTPKRMPPEQKFGAPDLNWNTEGSTSAAILRISAEVSRDNEIRAAKERKEIDDEIMVRQTSDQMNQERDRYEREHPYEPVDRPEISEHPIEVP